MISREQRRSDCIIGIDPGLRRMGGESDPTGSGSRSWLAARSARTTGQRSASGSGSCSTGCRRYLPPFAGRGGHRAFFVNRDASATLKLARPQHRHAGTGASRRLSPNTRRTPSDWVSAGHVSTRCRSGLWWRGYCAPWPVAPIPPMRSPSPSPTPIAGPGDDWGQRSHSRRGARHDRQLTGRLGEIGPSTLMS